MKNCPSVDIYDNLDFCPGETSMPGLRYAVYYIPKSSILNWPKLAVPSATGATMSSIATLDGNFTLAADAKWRRIDLVDGASSVKAESQGEAPSKSFLVTAAFKYGGNNAEATGFCRMANNDDMVYCCQQMDGKYRIIGNELLHTNTKPSISTGAAVTDTDAGTTLEATVSSLCPAPFYTGTLKTDEGTIDCSTGEIATD